jgi:hypothetical protein
MLEQTQAKLHSSIRSNLNRHAKDKRLGSPAGRRQ